MKTSKSSFIDSLSHPTMFDLNGSSLVEEYQRKGFKGALAVPLRSEFHSAHDLYRYFSASLKTRFFLPVWPYTNREDSADQVDKAVSEGCCAIKIHPRSLEWNWTTADGVARLEELFEAACGTLPLMFCTYFPHRAGFWPQSDPLIIFDRLLKKFPEAKVVLLHGGATRLLEYLEFARFIENILIDLSYSVTRYRCSSIFADFQFAYQNFDQRICFGSDYPYLPLSDAVDTMIESASGTKLEGSVLEVCSNNLEQFLFSK
jgi:predicted TIM-barrel fold metal-dependent hydrolase